MASGWREGWTAGPARSGSIWSAVTGRGNRIDARHLTGHVTARAECDQSVAGATAR